MTTDLAASDTVVEVTAPASGLIAPVEPAMEPPATPALVPEPAPASAPAAPKPKPITWETERNAAVAALARVGATPREARVLASLAANAATKLRSQGREKGADPATIDDRAATQVLAAHRAAASPAWMK